ncbi:MAG: hypothetical protein J6O41_06970 [Clostridia bacterium]|nr:hypothetical protein [Clostridia bacterium]
MLLLGTPVMGGIYKISSMPFTSKVMAYAEISAHWKGVEGTTYYDNGEWYIITK